MSRAGTDLLVPAPARGWKAPAGPAGRPASTTRAHEAHHRPRAAPRPPVALAEVPDRGPRGRGEETG